MQTNLYLFAAVGALLMALTSFHASHVTQGVQMVRTTGLLRAAAAVFLITAVFSFFAVPQIWAA